MQIKLTATSFQIIFYINLSLENNKNNIIINIILIIIV
jgi:hypothetical protein